MEALRSEISGNMLEAEWFVRSGDVTLKGKLETGQEDSFACHAKEFGLSPVRIEKSQQRCGSGPQ